LDTTVPHPVLTLPSSDESAMIDFSYDYLRA
jgi:hypothetical protein